MGLDSLAPYLFLLGGLLIAVSIVWYLKLWIRGENSRWDGADDGNQTVVKQVKFRQLPRLFLLGFTLSVVTGPLVLWLVVCDKRASRSDDPCRASIQEVLEERLLEPAVQREQHEELIGAIRSIGQPKGPELSVIRERIQLRPQLQLPRGADLLSLMGTIFLLAAGIIVFANLEGCLGRILGILIAVGALAAFFLANPDFVTLHADIKSSMEPGAATLGISASELHLEHLGGLGPFPSARHDTDETSMKVKLEKLLPRINRWAADERLGFLLLVGSADQRPLGVWSQETYGSNVGLAQARAEWVKVLLSRMISPQIDPARIIALASGPEHIGLDLPAKALESDRSVRIYACWSSPACSNGARLIDTQGILTDTQGILTR
ncbi:MAG: hypothetical protein KAY24_18400 [Candidatus Eisenbacteria sp.]|nr:hypothetical protein [Candidatus Eisenbacteria bacterium]